MIRFIAMVATDSGMQAWPMMCVCAGCHSRRLPRLNKKDGYCEWRCNFLGGHSTVGCAMSIWLPWDYSTLCCCYFWVHSLLRYLFSAAQKPHFAHSHTRTQSPSWAFLFFCGRCSLADVPNLILCIGQISAVFYWFCYLILNAVVYSLCSLL